MAIFALKNHHFYLYLPGALFYTDKTWFKLKVLLKEITWFLFEVNKSLHSKVMIIYISHEIL